MYVCICICMYVCIIRIYTYMHTHTHIHICIHIYIYVYIYYIRVNMLPGARKPLLHVSSYCHICILSGCEAIVLIPLHAWMIFFLHVSSYYIYVLMLLYSICVLVLLLVHAWKMLLHTSYSRNCPAIIDPTHTHRELNPAKKPE